MTINGAGHQLLARSTFTRNQRRCIRGGKLADEFEDALHLLASSNDSEVVVFRFEQGLIRYHLFHCAGGLESVENDLLKLGDIERLEQVVVGSEFHRLNGGLSRAV